MDWQATVLDDLKHRTSRFSSPREGIIIATLCLFVVLAIFDTWLSLSGAAEPFNTAVLSAVGTLRNATPWLTVPMAAVTHLGSDPVLFLIVLAFAIAAVKRKRRWDAVWLFLVAVAARLIGTSAKLLLQLPRPDLISPPPFLHSFIGYGFPSGHALMSTAVLGSAALLAMERAGTWAGRKAVPVLCLLLIPAIGFSRMYLGAHWPNDVLGGYLYGICILLAGWLLRRKLHRANQ